MNDQAGPYQVVDLTPGRRAWLNALDLPGPAHWMYALLEVDVTVARQFIAEHEARTGEKLSFTGYLVFCLARAVDEDKTVQAYLKGRKQFVLFDDVDVGVMIEHTDGEKKALMGHIIRTANRKTYREIHQEIRAVQFAPVPANRGMPTWFRSALLLPWPLSSLFKALFGMASRRDPSLLVAGAGTVSLTAVGMFGQGHSGWGIAAGTNSLNVVVGSTAWKPAVIEGRIEPRQILNLTLLFDHDIVDGAPAARFTRRLVELIESGYGLYDPAQPWVYVHSTHRRGYHPPDRDAQSRDGGTEGVGCVVNRDRSLFRILCKNVEHIERLHEFGHGFVFFKKRDVLCSRGDAETHSGL